CFSWRCESWFATPRQSAAPGTHGPLGQLDARRQGPRKMGEVSSCKPFELPSRPFQSKGGVSGRTAVDPIGIAPATWRPFLGDQPSRTFKKCSTWTIPAREHWMLSRTELLLQPVKRRSGPFDSPLERRPQPRTERGWRTHESPGNRPELPRSLCH